VNRIKQLWFPIAILVIIVVTAGWILAMVLNPSSVQSSEQVFITTDTPLATIVQTGVPTSTTRPSSTPTAVETSTQNPNATETIPSSTSELTEALNCTYTIYYWRVYPDAWGINSFEFDSRSYSKEQAMAILNLKDPNLITSRLLQQYFIALLNINNGADPSGIDRTLEQVNEWLIQHPPEAGLTQAESLEGETFTGALMDYNDGVTGPGRCLDEPLTPTPGATPTPLNYTPPTPLPTATNTPAPLGTIIFVPTPTPTKKPGGGGSKPKPTNPPPTSESTQPPPPPDTPEPPPPTDPPQPTQPPPTPAPTQPPPTQAPPAP
jgi:hypothetical protein